MENVYTCSCGSQKWIIVDNGVRCDACKRLFTVALTPVNEFNRSVLEEIEEMEEV